jgi:hypothetical protein
MYLNISEKGPDALDESFLSIAHLPVTNTNESDNRLS